MRAVTLLPIALSGLLLAPVARAGGEVQVLTDATGARISLDGQDIGVKAPTILADVPAGQHDLVLTKGCRRGQAHIEVADGDSVAVEVTLEELPGTLLVRPDPPEAEVTIDGTMFDPPQDAPATIACGDHTISARDYGHVPALVTIFVGPGEDVVLPVKLESLGVGFLQISVVPTNADLVLDQQKIGEGRLTDFEVIAGAHVLRAELDGYLPAERQFVLTDGGSATFDLTLHPTPREHHRSIDGAHLAGLGVGLVALGAGVVSGFEYTQTRSAYDEYRVRKDSVEAGNRPQAFAEDWFDMQVLPHRTRMQVAGAAAATLLAGSVVLMVTF